MQMWRDAVSIKVLPKVTTKFNRENLHYGEKNRSVRDFRAEALDQKGDQHENTPGRVCSWYTGPILCHRHYRRGLLGCRGANR